MHPALAVEHDSPPIPIQLVMKSDWEGLRPLLPAHVATMAQWSGFDGEAGKRLIVPGGDGNMAQVLFGLGDGSDPRALVALSATLPAGHYSLSPGSSHIAIETAAALWAEGAYRFTRYLGGGSQAPVLVLPQGWDAEAISAEAGAADLVRDLVNTPAEDMGPDGLEAAIGDLARQHGAEMTVITGAELLEHNYPLVHAVGRAGARAPRMIELSWGEEGHPVLAIVGKGVCFDTGGLNLKVGNYMRDMKKDMGGAAHAIGLARLVMDARLPVRLKLLVPAVENNVSHVSFRPGDVFASRKGLTVEIDNTDAEGRLVLADALTRACEHDPDLIIDLATLTGAARVALGADLAPFYTDDADLAAAIDIAGIETSDPVWRMPLWKPYASELKSTVADLVNSGGPLAGSITAALFLQQFVDRKAWVHFDIWAWRTARYTRPAGGATCALRACWQFLRARYGR